MAERDKPHILLTTGTEQPVPRQPVQSKMVEGVFQMPLTVGDINNRSAGQDERIRRFQKQIAKLILDAEKPERLKRGFCKACFYMRGGIVLPAFEDKPCKRLGCEGRIKEANRPGPNYCTKCSTDFGICRECGADLELKDRRSLKPPKRR